MTELETGIVADDAAALVAFYRDGLGFAVDSERTFPQGTVVRLRRDRARLKIFQPADPPEPGPEADPWHRFTGFAYAALLVADAAAEADRAAAAGATVVVAATEHRPGARFAMITDPAGNTLELLQEDQDGPGAR